MSQRISIPSDEEVRSLAHQAYVSGDRRAAPAVSLLLGYSLSTARLGKLRWANWDRVGGNLIETRSSQQEVIGITDYLHNRLTRIPRGASPFLFAPYAPQTPRLDVLFSHLLHRGRLSSFRAADFLAWSLSQSPAVRLATASA